MVFRLDVWTQQGYHARSTYDTREEAESKLQEFKDKFLSTYEKGLIKEVADVRGSAQSANL